MKRVILMLVLSFGAYAMAACSTEQGATEIVVVVDTDLLVPHELDHVHVEVIGPGRDMEQADEALTSTEKLPLRLGVVHGGGALKGVTIRVLGVHAGRAFVRRDAVADFVEHRIVTLHLDLLRACVDLACASNETCGTQNCAAGATCKPSCRPIEIAPSELVPWSGVPPRVLTSIGAGGNAGTGGNAGIGGDQHDGGSMAGSDASVVPNGDGGVIGPSCHFGDGLPCGGSNVLNASSTCVADQCEVTCNPGYDDCNAIKSDGCEASLGAPASCGTCSTKCSGSTPLCQSALTGGFSCVDGCSGNTEPCGSSCVDVQSDLQNCGACGAPCATPNAIAGCNSGKCEVATCFVGRDDCNGEASDGCETDINFDLANCGQCKKKCVLGAQVDAVACNGGGCDVVSCISGFEDCDSSPGNGCEAEVAIDKKNCGTCKIKCDGECVMGVCQ